MNATEHIWPATTGIPEPITRDEIRRIYDEAHLHRIGLFANMVTAKTGANLLFGQALERTEIRLNGSGIYFEAHGRMYGIGNEPLGHYDGVIEPSGSLNLKDIMTPPPAPPGPIERPGSIPQIPVLGKSKVDFVFNEMDSVTVVGQGSAHLTRRRDGTKIFMITAMNLVTGGTGIYYGAAGIQAATGTTILPEGVELSGGTTLHFITFYTLQITCRHKETVQVFPNLKERSGE